VPRKHPNVSRRSAHPSIRVSEAKVKRPGRKTAPREREWLFDIVRWELPKTVGRRAVTSVVLILRSAHAEEIPRIRARRARVSKDEDGHALMLRDAPQRTWAVEALALGFRSEGRRILAKRTQRAFWPSGSSPRGAPRGSKSAFTRVCDALCVAGTPLWGPMVTAGGYGSRLSLRSAGTTIAWSERSINPRLCEMTAGAISLFWDCYLQ